MTTDDPFGRTLAAWLEDDARTRVPAHLAEALVQTLATRQRRWWSSPERWLPMNLTATRTAVPHVPAVRIVVAALLLLILGVALVVVAGAQPRVPPPFGPARNGALVHESGGDIVALDPATGRSTIVVGGSENDRTPRVSPDGTSIVFDREVAGSAHRLMLVGVDGTGLRPLGGLITEMDAPVWSPDATRVAVDAEIDGLAGIRIVGVDGGVTLVLPQQPGSRTQAVADVQWRHDGTGLLFRGWQAIGQHFGLWTINADGSGLLPILPTDQEGRESLGAALSPDGTTVAYSYGDEGRIRLVDVVNGRDRPLSYAGDIGDDVTPVWSPDGSRVAFLRLADQSSRVVVGPAGGGSVVETGPAFPDDAAPTIAFAPDGSKLIARFPGDGSTWLLDPAGGPAQRLAIDTSELPAWQRLAP